MSPSYARPPDSEPLLPDRSSRTAVEAVRHLVDSADPAVVFTSLARIGAAHLADECTVNLVLYGRPLQHIRSTPDGTDSNRTAAWTVTFASRFDIDDPFFGVAKFVWREREPTVAEQMNVSLLVDRAVAAVAHRRMADEVANARSGFATMRSALESRERVGVAIGILMHLYSCTAAGALIQLKRVSARRGVDLREIAEDVISTGRLDLR